MCRFNWVKTINYVRFGVPRYILINPVRNLITTFNNDIEHSQLLYPGPGTVKLQIVSLPAISSPARGTNINIAQDWTKKTKKAKILCELKSSINFHLPWLNSWFSDVYTVWMLLAFWTADITVELRFEERDHEHRNQGECVAQCSVTLSLLELETNLREDWREGPE